MQRLVGFIVTPLVFGFLGCGSNNKGSSSSATGGAGYVVQTGGSTATGGNTAPGGSSSGGAGGTAATTGGSSNTCPNGVVCNGACLDAGESEGNCTVLAKSSNGSVNALAQDADYIYIAFYSSVARVPKAGGALEKLADGSSISAIAVNDSSVFWSESDLSSATLRMAPKAGGSARDIGYNSDDIGPILADATRVYYFMQTLAYPSDVVSQTLSGGTTLAYGTSNYFQGMPISDGTYLYWGDDPVGETATLWRSPLDSAAKEPVATQSKVYFPILHGDSIYFYESFADKWYKVVKSGGTPTVVTSITTMRSMNAVMVGNDTEVFWTSSTGVMRMPYDGSSPRQFADVGVNYSMQADANSLYVATWNHVLKITL